MSKTSNVPVGSRWSARANGKHIVVRVEGFVTHNGKTMLQLFNETTNRSMAKPRMASFLRAKIPDQQEKSGNPYPWLKPYAFVMGKVDEKWSMVEVMSYAFPDGSRVSVNVRTVLGDPASLIKLFAQDTTKLRVRCERDRTEFEPDIRSYPSGGGNASKNYDAFGDLQIVCPCCSRAYFHYNQGKDLKEMKEEWKKGWHGWHSDRPLTILRAEVK